MTKEQAEKLERAIARGLKNEDIDSPAAAMVENILKVLGIEYTWCCYSNDNIEGIYIKA